MWYKPYPFGGVERTGSGWGSGPRRVRCPPDAGIVAPGENRAFDTAARSLLALGLGWQAEGKPGLIGEPGAKTERLIEVHSHDGLIGRFEAGSAEERRAFVSGRVEEPAVLSVRHRRRGHLELRDVDPMHRLFVRANPGAPHEEFARWDENAIEEPVRT